MHSGGQVTPAPLLVHGAISLHPLQPRDEAEYIRLANEPTISGRVNHPQPYTASHFEALLADVAKQVPYYVWMIHRHGVVCGAINSADMRTVGVFQGGYWVDPAHRGHGISAIAVGLVNDFLWSLAGTARIQALVEPDNHASIAVLEKCGYTREGLLRRFYPARNRGLIDVYMYARVKE